MGEASEHEQLIRKLRPATGQLADPLLGVEETL